MGPGTPQIGRKCNNRHKKEDADYLKPEDASDAPEGTDKSADSPHETPARPACNAARRQCRLGFCLSNGGANCLCRCPGLRTGRQLAAGDAQYDSHDTADRVSSHSVYDGNSDPCSMVFRGRGCLLHFIAIRRIVEQSHAATGAPYLRRPPFLEVLMTSRLRELIQQLGEAIHESVIESEQIAGVVQDIRQYGFDVLLMLEATIGLNEVTNKDAESAVAEGEKNGEGSPFTPNDLSFLRSLRISVEGGDDEKAEDDQKAE